MGEKKISSHSYDAYLTLEAESGVKYEFHDGFIVAMAGGTLEHGQVGGNFIRTAGNVLIENGKPCSVFTSDVKIHIASARRSYYPDASIVCGTPERSSKDRNALINPILILEVLSDSTEAFDRGAKFNYYRELPSFQEYVLISQEEALVDTYFRTKDNTWEINSYRGLDAMVPLKSIDCEISMTDIYWLVPGIHPFQ